MKIPGGASCGASFEGITKYQPAYGTSLSRLWTAILTLCVIVRSSDMNLKRVFLSRHAAYSAIF